MSEPSAIVSKLDKKLASCLINANSPVWHTDFLPCGIPPVDYALCGGACYGRVLELIGLWQSGKTLLLYMFLAMNQRLGGESYLCEAEGAFNADFFKMMGGDPNKLKLYSVSTCEEVLDFIYSMAKAKIALKSKMKVVIGWDSIAATGTQHLLDTEMEVRDMSKANVMNQGSMKISTVLDESNICVISTNQVRDKIGSMSSEVHTPGGKAWPFLASQRIHLEFDGGKASYIQSEDGTTTIGRIIKGQVIKNKCGSPWGVFSMPVFTQDGWPHPSGYKYKTTVGIDARLSLWEAYIRSRIMHRMPDDTRIPLIIGQGWYNINPEIVPSFAGKAQFRATAWPDVLAENPWLWNYPYTREIPNVAQVAAVSPATENPHVQNLEQPTT